MPHQFIKISVVWYDKDGKLLYTDSTYAEPDTLQPGEKATFQTMTEALTPVEKYDIIDISYTTYD